MPFNNATVEQTWVDHVEVLMDNITRFQLVGGLPRKRLRYLVHVEGRTQGVAWDASGEVRTIPPGEFLFLEGEADG